MFIYNGNLGEQFFLLINYISQISLSYIVYQGILVFFLVNSMC